MPRKRARPAITDVIAERVFQRGDGGEVRTLVGRPHKAEQGWECDFQIVGVSKEKVFDAPGVDSLQALQMALALMAVHLEALQREHGLTLEGDADLALMKPDHEAMRREIEAKPDFPQWGPAVMKVWEE